MMDVETADKREVNILLIEDDDGDAKAVQRAFKDTKIVNPFLRAEDGVEALEILRGEHPEKRLKKPYILLVDINMPRMNGIDLVKNLREDPILRKSVVFILTTSKDEKDKTSAYDLNVAGYILKSTAGRDFLRLSEMIENYWRIIELPE